MELVLSKNLQKARKAIGLTQEQLASSADIPLRTYQDIERGVNWPQRKNIRAIAAALSVEEISLFSHKTSPREALELFRDALNDPTAFEHIVSAVSAFQKKPR